MHDTHNRIAGCNFCPFFFHCIETLVDITNNYTQDISLEHEFVVLISCWNCEWASVCVFCVMSLSFVTFDVSAFCNGMNTCTLYIIEINHTYLH